MRSLLGRFHVTGVFWFKIHRFGMSILPEWGVWVIVTFFTTFFFFALIKIRKGIAINLEAVLGPCGWWQRQVRIYKTMWTFAWCLSERYERLATEHCFACTIDGEDRWHEILDDERGFIVVTAHIGHWELGSMLASSRQEQRHVHVIREEEMDPRAQEFMHKLINARDEARYTVHFAKADDPDLGMTLLGALRRGEIIALQGDRPRAHGSTVTVPLFGRPFELPSGPAALARAAEVNLVPTFTIREGRKHSRVVVCEPITVARTKDRNRDIQEALEALAAEIERAIREQPHQWFCFRPLWPS
jgi:KDO2-lipid IV(A) lauroyltransferase